MKHVIVLLCLSMGSLSCMGCGPASVQCSSIQDCTDPNAPFCDTQAGNCVACVEDSQCGDGFICDDNMCHPGCRSENDRCGPGQVCRPGAACVECIADVQCGAGRVCSTNNTCVPGCSAANPACPMGLVCDTNAGACVECTSNANCPNEPLRTCDTTTHTCVQCVTSNDCHDAATPACNPATHTCTQCVVNDDCGGGACVMNRCVQCTADAQCSGATPTCNTTTNTCVACVPGVNDHCPQGQYCRPDFTCEQGCKTGADCPSGVCLPNHSCQGCTMDSQCAAGNICNTQTGVCVGACGATNPCASGQTCCAATSRCIDLQNDSNNCGACGRACGANSACCAGACRATNSLTNCGACNRACGADQFCDGTTCRNQTFPEFCANRNVVAIRDGITLDNAATATLASTIQQYCSSQTMIRYADDTDPTVVDQATGALLTAGGTTVVTAGGPFPNLPVKWLERTRQVTKVYFANNVTGTEFYFRQRSDGGTLITKQQTSCSVGMPDSGTPTAMQSDVFLIELATDPTSATLELIGYGLCSPGNGTAAAAYYWANVMLPNRTMYPDSWYIYEWQDTNRDGVANLGDTFVRQASGR